MRALDRVRTVMEDGIWRTSYELRNACLSRFGIGGSDSGLTARLRELRDPNGENREVLCRVRKAGKQTYYEYRLVPQEDKQLALFA